MTAEQLTRLRFAPSILARLGEELIPDSDQGLLELARNSYDAGATNCTIQLAAAEARGGSVIVTDDGDGMTLEEIKNGFLVLGASRKGRYNHGRPIVGEKGLGRLAALRLGARTTLFTRPRDQGVEHRLHIDWSSFDTASVVEDVPLEIETSPTTAPHGSTIEISDLHHPITKAQQTSLARALLLLEDPFGGEGEFQATLQTEAFGDLSKIIRGAYLGAADYRLTAVVDSSGRASAHLFDVNGEEIHSGELGGGNSGENLYDCPPATLEIYVFRLGGGAKVGAANLRLRQVGVNKVRKWLRSVGGVHLYHRGLRVRPFGDPGYDWLHLDLSRARSPEDRPSTNTVVGRVSVEDLQGALTPKTDRVGFVENEAFVELRRFAVDATEFMARWRVEDSRLRREAEKQRKDSELERARRNLDKAVGQLPDQNRAAIEGAVRKLDRASKRRDESRLRDIQLYRTLSTIGAATAVFAHETDKPTEQLISLLTVARRRASSLLGDDFNRLEEPFRELDRVAHGLRAASSMPLRMLKASRRRVQSASVGATVDETLGALDYYLDSAHVRVERSWAMDDHVRAPAAAIDVMAANLVVNSIAAFYRHGHGVEDRILRLETTVDEARVHLTVSDNGPGITVRPVDDVWKLGVTTREGGSGLGLTIVRETVADLGGEVHAASPGDLGGATITLTLPKAQTLEAQPLLH